MACRTECRRRFAAAVWLALCGFAPGVLTPMTVFGADGSPPTGGCDDARYRLLDFWLGEWVVFADGQRVGVTIIEKILDGCAGLEHWQSSGGGEGKSLFFVDDENTWQQVWVTERAAAPGGVKQKTRVPGVEPPSVRFQGVVRHFQRGEYLDRTTLTPLDNGDVRQLIEISRDDGESWRTTFDAVYRPFEADGS